jgi:ATP-dependent Zn protease
MKMSPVVRTLLFWVLRIGLASVLWNLANNGSSQEHALPQTSYSDFRTNVDRSNIKSAKLLESSATAEMQGQLGDPAHDFTQAIPQEVIPDLMEQLRKRCAVLEVSEMNGPKTASWSEGLIHGSPILLIVGIWIYRMRSKMEKQTPRPQGGPASGPLG